MRPARTVRVRVRSIVLATLAGLLATVPARAELVEMRTSDGFILVGDLLAGAPSAPAVILLHMYRSDRTAWVPLVPKLRAAGYTVLALDQRAHGDSTRYGDGRLRVADIPSDRFGAVVREGVADVAAARALLAERGLGKGGLALVGASYGCTVSLLAATQQPSTPPDPTTPQAAPRGAARSEPKASEVGEINALVLLSPGTAYFGVDVTAAARSFPGPVLGVAAEDDKGSARGTRALLEAHAGPEELLVYPSGGHGTRLFGPRPEVMARIVDFLGGALSR